MTEPRFFIDHGMIHDRLTGKHVTTEPDTPFCDGLQSCCELLNDLANPRPSNYEARHPNDMVLHPLAEIQEWDDALRELGIQDSNQTPAQAVRELNAEIEYLRAELAQRSPEASK
jgi:hypothetical protein